MDTLRMLLATAAVLLSTVACASGSSDQLVRLPATGDAEIQVTNNNWSDMVVYMERAGMRTRLGTVTSMNTVRFSLPDAYAHASAGVQLVADPVGSSESYATPPVQVAPGQVVDFTIENQLTISNVSVW